MTDSMTSLLRKKGWTEEEIQKSKEVLDDPEGVHFFSSSLSKVVYWSGLVVGVVGNLVISTIMIPFFAFLDARLVYLILCIVGFIFGSLFSILLYDLRYLDAKHHVIASIFIPFMALLNVYVMFTLINYLHTVIFDPSFATSLNLQSHNPLVMSVLYVGFFLLPIVVSKIRARFH